eukprot:scaffold3835_cov295-Chaetoceros_neogracile.AAC.6
MGIPLLGFSTVKLVIRFMNAAIFGFAWTGVTFGAAIMVASSFYSSHVVLVMNILITSKHRLIPQETCHTNDNENGLSNAIGMSSSAKSVKLQAMRAPIRRSIVKAFRLSRGLKEERSALNESFDDEFEHEA